MDVKEPAVLYSDKQYSIEEYFEIEEAALEKHEFFNGEIIEMAPRNITHNIISGNTFLNLFNNLKSQLYRPFIGNQRIFISENNSFVYPDISVIPLKLKLVITTIGIF